MLPAIDIKSAQVPKYGGQLRVLFASDCYTVNPPQRGNARGLWDSKRRLQHSASHTTPIMQHTSVVQAHEIHQCFATLGAAARGRGAARTNHGLCKRAIGAATHIQQKPAHNYPDCTPVQQLICHSLCTVRTNTQLTPNPRAEPPKVH